jgi:ATP-dependent protease ClpP protease subunit
MDSFHSGIQTINTAAPVRFGHVLLNDSQVAWPEDTPLNDQTTAQTLNHLIFQNLAHDGEKHGTLKLLLTLDDTDMPLNGAPEAALSDMTLLLGRKTDIILRGLNTSITLHTLQSAPGKRFMTSNALLAMFPFDNRGKDFLFKSPMGNDDVQIRRRLYNAYQRDLETLVMQRAGVKSRRKVSEDLGNGRYLNSMDALAYGKNGLIDHILVGHDRVITRSDLDATYRRLGINSQREKDHFNKDLDNLKEIPTRPLREVVPDSMPTEELSPLPGWELPPKPNSAQTKQPTLRVMTGDKVAVLSGIPDRVTVQAPKNARLPDRYLVEQVSEQISPSILNSDVIHVTGRLDDRSGSKVMDALNYLAQKKKQQGSDIPIRLLINVHGADSSVPPEINDVINAIAEQGVKTDIIAYGNAASGGASLLSGASGVRLVTPNTRVMIHQSQHIHKRSRAGERFNHRIDYVHYSTEEFQREVAKASGRSDQEVAKDFRFNNYFNPLEALFYGKNGLTDGILVGPNSVITRESAESHLAKKMGSKEAVRRLAEKSINAHRDVDTSWKPEEHNEKDPFQNHLRTIREIIEAGGATSFAEAPLAKLRESKPVHRDAFEYFNIIN